jgi:hypothetical protein
MGAVQHHSLALRDAFTKHGMETTEQLLSFALPKYYFSEGSYRRRKATWQKPQQHDQQQQRNSFFLLSQLGSDDDAAMGLDRDVDVCPPVQRCVAAF